MFAMVWLLPVPGGPSMTKDLPASAAATQARCEESASSIRGTASGGAFSSMSRSEISSKAKRSRTPALTPAPPRASAWTVACPAISPSLSRRSRYIASFAKEKHDSVRSSVTVQFL